MATPTSKSNSNPLSALYGKLVVGNEKAVTAFIVAAVGSFIARHGLTLNASALAYLQAVVLGAIAHGAVYLKANSAS